MAGRLFLLSTAGMAAAMAVLSTGCNGNKPREYTSDLRIDGASDDNDPESFGTKMCMTDDGTIYVIWLDNRDHPGDEEQVDIWMNRSKDLGAEKTWLPTAVRVNQGEGNVWNPSLFCNEAGVFVVWEDDRDGELKNHQIYFNRSVDGGETFLEEDILLEEKTDPNGLSMSLEPKITGYGEDLFVVWYDSLYGAYDILVSVSSDAGLQWRDPIRVDSDTQGDAYSARPRIAAGKNGLDIWVAWEDSRDGKADIYFARSDSGGADFKEDERLDEGDDDGANDSFEPQLCTDSSSNVYVVWHDARGGKGRDIYMNYSGNKGADWQGIATRLDTDGPGFGNSLFPVCAVDGSTMHVAWQDKRDTDLAYDIFYREVDAGAPGKDEVRLDVGRPVGYANSLDPRIVQRDGTVMVAWRDGRGEVALGTDNGFDDLYYNFRDPETPWRENEEDGDLRMDSMYDGQSFKVDLNVALLGGSWYAAWTDGRGGTSDIYFVTYGIGDESRPPLFEALQQAQGQ